MKEKTSALHSKYIIDGIARKLAPSEILDGCLVRQNGTSDTDTVEYEPIVDESTDPSPSTVRLGSHDVAEYLAGISPLLDSQRSCPAAYAEPFTKGRIAKALTDAMWMKGHFRLSDLTLTAKWRWNSRPLGNMAAFYSSVEAAAEYLEGLGICLSGYSFTESSRINQVTFKVGAIDRPDSPDDGSDDEIDLPLYSPFGSEHPVIGRHRAVPDKLVPDPESWIIYIPFDSCGFRLGGSLLCDALGQNGDNFPEIGDADYFIDCYEVVREFVEDSVLVSAVTVSDGGLLTALKSMCGGNVGAKIDISGIMNAYGEDRSVRALFSEVPGALVQIKDIDYDYVDAEILLQDIAYYPVGHPSVGSGKVEVKTGGGGGISDILQSLLSSQASEGED